MIFTVREAFTVRDAFTVREAFTSLCAQQLAMDGFRLAPLYEATGDAVEAGDFKLWGTLVDVCTLGVEGGDDVLDEILEFARRRGIFKHLAAVKARMQCRILS